MRLIHEKRVKETGLFRNKWRFKGTLLKSCSLRLKGSHSDPRKPCMTLIHCEANSIVFPNETGKNPFLTSPFREFFGITN
jgi:hypothetical protein